MKCGARGLASRPLVKSSQTPKKVEAWEAQVKGLPGPVTPAPRSRQQLPVLPFLAPTPVPCPPERPRVRPQRLGNGRRPRLQRRQPGGSSVGPQCPHSRPRREPGGVVAGSRWGPGAAGLSGTTASGCRGTSSSLPFEVPGRGPRPSLAGPGASRALSVCEMNE